MGAAPTGNNEMSIGQGLGALVAAHEGAMAQAVLAYWNRYSSSSPYVAQIILPYLAFAAYDSCHLLNQYGTSLQPAAFISEIRCGLKYLNGGGGFQAYRESAEKAAVFQRRCFGTSSTGNRINRWFRRFRRDMSITFVDNIPFGSDWISARFCGYGMTYGAAAQGADYQRIGFKLGECSAGIVALASNLGISNHGLSEMNVAAVDTSFDHVIMPVVEMCNSTLADAISMLFLELALGINAVNAFSKYGLMDEVAWQKHMLVTLYHGCASFKALGGMLSRGEYEGMASDVLKEYLARVFPRDVRKVIERAKPLRNALVHYDFSEVLAGWTPADDRPALDEAVKRTMGMENCEEFSKFMHEESVRVSNMLLELFQMPRFKLGC